MMQRAIGLRFMTSHKKSIRLAPWRGFLSNPLGPHKVAPREALGSRIHHERVKSAYQ